MHFSCSPTPCGNSGLRVTNGSLVGGVVGIYFYSDLNGADPHFDNLSISGQSYGIYVTGDSTVDNRVATIVEDCRISATYTGAYLRRVSNALITHNVVTGGNYGLWLYIVSRSTLRENAVSGASTYGIYGQTTAGSDYNRFIGNLITGSGAVGGGGILIYGNSNTIAGNGLSANYVGLWLLASDNNLVYDNNLSSNTSTGLHLSNGSDGNQIHHNTASKNGTDGISTEDVDHYNTFQYNTASENSSRGINIYSDRNTIDWNTVIMNTACGITLQTGADYNIVTNNRGPYATACSTAQPYWVDNNGLFNVVNSSNLPW